MNIIGKQEFRVEGAIVFCKPRKTVVDGQVAMTSGFKACTTSSERNAKAIAEALNKTTARKHIKALSDALEKIDQTKESKKLIEAAKKWMNE